MICPSCGNTCEDNLQFCPDCGYRLSIAPVTPVAEPQAPVIPVQEQPPVAQTVAPGLTPNAAPNYGYVPPVYHAEPVRPAAERKSGLVLTMGIISCAVNLQLGLCGCLGTLPGLVCAIIGLIFGFKNRRTYQPGEKDAKNKVGLILCFVALGLFVFFSILNAVLGALSYLEGYSYGDFGF